MPLLVGLVDTARRNPGNLDGTPLQAMGASASPAEDIDLEELSAKRISGGGMLNSVANMANSILGAGKHARYTLTRTVHIK